MSAADRHGPSDGRPDLPERTKAQVGATVAAVAWLLVFVIELVDVPNSWLLVLIVPVFEALIWVIAVGSAFYISRCLAKRFGGRHRRIGVVTALIGGILFVYFTNWSLLEPRSYYLIHRWGFSEVAVLVEEGDLGRPADNYYGQRLPRYVADLSTTGRAATVGSQDGQPIVFLPQYLGLPPSAVGFVYVDGRPNEDLVIDLFGSHVTLADGIQLGDGWWYVVG